jgi:hypothetical protein
MLEDERLEEIRRESKVHSLSGVTADWIAHEKKIISALPNFAGHNLYQAQDFSEAEYSRAMERVRSVLGTCGPTDLDREYGAHVVTLRTKALHLFTVARFDYHTNDGRSFRALIEAHFMPIAEEDVSVHAGCPLVLWRRK